MEVTYLSMNLAQLSYPLLFKCTPSVVNLLSNKPSLSMKAEWRSINVNDSRSHLDFNNAFISLIWSGSGTAWSGNHPFSLVYILSFIGRIVWTNIFVFGVSFTIFFAILIILSETYNGVILWRSGRSALNISLMPISMNTAIGL